MPMSKWTRDFNRLRRTVFYTNPGSVPSAIEADDDSTETTSQSELRFQHFPHSTYSNPLSENTDADSNDLSETGALSHPLAYIRHYVGGSSRLYVSPRPYGNHARVAKPSTSPIRKSFVTSQFSVPLATAHPRYMNEKRGHQSLVDYQDYWNANDVRREESGTETSSGSVASLKPDEYRIRSRRVFSVVTVIIAIASGVAAFLLYGSMLRSKALTEEAQVPVVFHADGNVHKGGIRTLLEIVVATPVFVENVGGNMEQMAFPVHPGNNEAAKATTAMPRRPKKIAMWESKHIYEIRRGDETSTSSSSAASLQVVNAQEPKPRMMVKPDATVTTRETTSTFKTTRVTKSIVPRSTKRRATPGVTLGDGKLRYCETEICDRELVYLTNYLDWNVKPCFDFYRFVCGRWNHLYPSVGASIDALLVEKVEEDVYRVLTKRRSPDNRVLKTEALINACVKKPFSNNHLSTLLEFMGGLGLRGWPFLKDTKTLTDVWKAASLLIRNLALPTLVAVNVEVDPESEQIYLISLGEPSLLIGQYGTKNSQLPRWYTTAITTCFKILDSGKYDEIAERVRDFASRLAEISTNRGLEIFGAHHFKVVQLNHYSNLIQLLTFVFNNITVVHSRMNVIAKSEVYLKKLGNVIQLSKGVDILNYMGFRALVHISPLLPDLAREMAALQMKEITGIYRPIWPRWRRCVRMLEQVAPVVFLHAYADADQPLGNEDEMWSLLNDIKGTFASSLSNAPWMSVGDKKAMKDRLFSLKLEVFRKFLGKSNRKRYAAEFLPDVEQGSIVVAYKSLAAQLVESKLSKIKYARDPTVTEWKGSVFDTNPVFDRESESVFVPAALFDPSYLIDGESVLLQVPRVATKVIAALFASVHPHNLPADKLKWSTDTELGYRDVQNCVAQQHEGSDESRTRTEVRAESNVIDSMSLLPAFKLFLRRVNQVSIEDYGLLTGVNVSVKQLFFILYAKGFCETMDSERRREIREESPFSINSWRVNVPLRNSFRFPTFWDCPSDTEMNPNQKCTLWTS